MHCLIAALIAIGSAPPELEPLAPDLVEAFAAIPADPASTNNETHYLVSNERRPDLFRAAVRRSGGVLIGVGAEQNYVLAGWGRPELLVLLDFDPVVGDLHTAYRALFLEAPTAEDFLALWATPAAAQAAITRHTPDPDRRARAVAAFALGAPGVHRRLADLARKPPGGVTNFMARPAQYRYLVSLFRAERVVVVSGDLTGARAMPALATAIRAANLQIRTLYLSNAEQYFMYGDGYRQNILALPMDAESMVLRTLPGRPRDFEYITQSGLGFQASLRSKRIRSVYAIRGLRKGEHLVGETSHRVDKD